VLPFERADIFARQDLEVLKTGRPAEWEIEQTLADGERQVTLISKFPVYSEDGGIIAVGGFNVDITERKQAEEALRESEKRLRLFTDAMPALFSYVDKDRRYRFCNLHYERYFRKKRRDITGRTLEEILGPRAYGQIKSAVDRALAGETVFYERWIDYREAGRAFMRGSLVPDISDTGEVEGFFVMSQDMTAKKRVEDSLARARDKAEETSASKSRFLAAASHDLRQPMQALAMFVEVLAGRSHDAESRAIIEKIQASSKSLERLLSSLLDISRLEADLVTPLVRRFAVGELTSRLADEIRPLAEVKGLALSYVPSDQAVMSDPGLLDRILRNLLTNAVANTESGRILFGCRRRGADVAIEVWDTGVGVADDQKSRIFEEFYQGGGHIASAQGLGLGLAIVDRLAALLGHRIEVDSEVAKGSVFRVVVPAADAAPREAATESVAERDSTAGGLVVGIDDDPAVRDALSLLLESWGFETVIAASEGDAVRQLSQANRRPDLVIADYRLTRGGMGSDAIHAIQARWGRRIPGLLLTGDTDPAHLQQANATGFKVVEKPIRPEELKTVVTEQMDLDNGDGNDLARG